MALFSRDDQEVVRELTAAIRSIAHGGVDGPAGIEALTMAIGRVDGSSHNISLATALSEGLHEVAEAQREGLLAIASAIRSTRAQ